MRAAMPVLAAQHFAGNGLIRGLAGRKLESLLASPDPSQKHEFALVADRRIAVAQPAPSELASSGGNGGGEPAVAVRWLDSAGLAALDIRHAGGEQLQLLDNSTGSSGQETEGPAASAAAEEGSPDAAAAAAGSGSPISVPVYFLGEDRQRRTLRLAVDVTGAPGGWAERRGVDLQSLLGISPSASPQDLRTLMPLLPAAELAVAGHAMALSQWHQAHLFCGRCGAPTAPADGGSRRQCSRHEEHRAYPRTDPVVIMLVESPDGRQALLGRSQKMRAGMLTCLSGFCDQGEGIEEAVARETREEAGIEVVAVDIVGSQPWPVGRGGSCELMIGCLAKAASADLRMDPEEMEEVRWVGREEVAEAVRLSSQPDSPYLGGRGGEAGRRLGFFVPPPFAIAHHLLKRWAEHGGPWFAQGQQAGREAGAEAAPAPASNL